VNKAVLLKIQQSEEKARQERETNKNAHSHPNGHHNQGYEHGEKPDLPFTNPSTAEGTQAGESLSYF
jgi:hypothetical protein